MSEHRIDEAIRLTREDLAREEARLARFAALDLDAMTTDELIAVIEDPQLFLGTFELVFEREESGDNADASWLMGDVMEVEHREVAGGFRVALIAALRRLGEFWEYCAEEERRHLREFGVEP